MSHNTEFPMKEYLGVEFVEKKVNFEDVIRIIRNETECKRPLIVNMDAFCCHWTRQYNKEHDGHSVIVTGIDEKNNIYCNDLLISHIFKRPALMEFSDFKNGYKSYLSYNFHYDTERFDWKDVLAGALLCSIYQIDIRSFYNKKKNIKNPFIFKMWLKKIKYSSVKTMFGDLEFFAKTLRKLEKFEDEIENKMDIIHSPIFYKIRDLANGRRKFAITLKFLGEQFGVGKLFEYSERLNAIGWSWEDIKCRLYESFENCDFSLIKNSSVHISCISGDERKLAFEILKFCLKD